ncbi:MAG: DUF4180 domain-containing protein [Chloroflexota bacterium]
MDYTFHEGTENAYVEMLPGLQPIADEQDALQLVAACAEYGAQRLLLPAECLAPQFFDLKSGLAGAVLLKLGNYRIRAALVAPDELTRQGRFYEFALETNRGQAFRIFNDRAAALQWLQG